MSGKEHMIVGTTATATMGIKKKRERITALLLKCKKSDYKKPPDEKKER